MEETCVEIFEKAVKQPDFGNGRFARNVLERAIMQQSQRLMNKGKTKKLSRKAMQYLRAADFDGNIVEEKKQVFHLGF